MGTAVGESSCAIRVAKVFYGNNLFAKGACIAVKDRLEDRKLKGYRYLSDSLVDCRCGNGYACYGVSGILSAD